MLQIKQSKPLFALKERHVGKFALVELKSLRIGCSFTWLSVDDEDARDLRELCKYNLVVVFDLSHDSIGEEISVALIIFRLM